MATSITRGGRRRTKPRWFGQKGHLPPTEREIDFLRYVAAEISDTGCQPSYREIMERYGWTSTNSVRSLVENLESKGLAHGGGCARGIHFEWRKYL